MNIALSAIGYWLSAIFVLEQEQRAMCRSIKQLRQPEQPPSDDEVYAAALQYVRKISGYRAPSRANQAAFESAVAEIAAATRRLCDRLGSSMPARTSS
jgi:hypothetical protein